MHYSDIKPEVRKLIADGTVIPAHPLALDSSRKLDIRHQRALSRYYIDAGAGGLAVGVHTTQFAIRETGMYRQVLELAAETASAWTKRPLAMVAGDFDEDGVGDLAIGYAISSGGSIALLHGNLDAHAPQTQESWLAAGRHQYSDPYLQTSKPISITSQPGLMVAADVNGDGHLDLVFAATGSSQIFVMFGDGKGNFLAPIRTSVAGPVTALTASVRACRWRAKLSSRAISRTMAPSSPF